MKTKSPAQLTDLGTARDYLAMVERLLKTAGEPSLAMTVSSLAAKLDLTLNSNRTTPVAP